jgi:hypothetical protein
MEKGAEMTVTNVAPDDARHDYIARVYKMTHAELFNELMRVHTEAAKLVKDAVEAERQALIQIIDDYVDAPYLEPTLKAIEARSNPQ